ncbi:glycine--tRNA ligase subunit alpha [Candidatus Fokinia crypta]|uniref:Glycine--tRNA ligase alpha subunit n=1 Tax=Candidatus Fokinia crypta TaxID=1920990 RepID=A0ABZ0UQK4_9RICK|nr:glycine--tRNA ligase subunit alpha [Candidatus Fokinia cryptica]WPX97984.1 Glycine--tRNA ligase alpha subunit [Candidatus Fokinia cryptica]
MFFQDIKLALIEFWIESGCALLEGYDMKVGAGTSHPATALMCLTKNPWNVVYVQPSTRPTDGRYAITPNRTQFYYQLQVIMKPSPDNIQALCIQSLRSIGLKIESNNICFIEDDWQNPTLGASGLGWELQLNGTEVLQFTYMQQIGGFKCHPVPCEITYGLERLGMHIQNTESFWDIIWSPSGVTYGELFKEQEKAYSHFNFEYANTEMLLKHFQDNIAECKRLLMISHEQNINLVIQAYDYFLSAAHLFNLLEARKVITVVQRTSYMKILREVSTMCCKEWVKFEGKNVASQGINS